MDVGTDRFPIQWPEAKRRGREDDRQREKEKYKEAC